MSILSDFNVERFEGILKNGIRVVLFYRHGAPIATTATLLSGSRYDPEHAPGMAHFIEHMISNGSSVFPSKDLLAEHIESIGGAFGARTNQEFMWVETEISEKSDFSRVVDIFNATLCNPLMDKDVFENEKKIVIKEIQKSQSNPFQILVKTARELFFQGSVLEHQVLGDELSIKSIKYDEMLDTYKKLFDVSRITFTVSGDITIEEIMINLNTLNFKQGQPILKSPEPVTSLDKKKVLATYIDTTQTHLAFGVPFLSSLSKDLIYLNLLGSILAGGRNARLTKRLRYKKGLVYSVGFTKYGAMDMSQWVITTDTSEDKIQEVVDEIVEEIKDIQKNGVKESELEFVKNKKIKSVKRFTQTSKDWIEIHNTGEAYAPDEYMDIDKQLEVTKAATLEDIQKVIDLYLVSDKWQLAMCGRTKDSSVNIEF